MNRKNAIRLLEELVAIPSVFPNEKGIADYCVDYLKGIGFSVELQYIGNERYNVVGTKGNAQKSIALFGHIDTVPPYGYERNPYKISKEGDRLYGLGAWDMKAGIALILTTAAKLVPSEKRGVKVVLSADEENISLGSWRLVKEGYVSGVELIITPEIADDFGGNASEHPAPLILGRRGRTVYGIEVNGEVAHGATGKGVSALSGASEIIRLVENMPLPNHPKLGPMRLFVRSMHSESTSLSIPETANLELDVHLVPPYTPQIFMEKIKEYLDKGLGGKRIKWNIRIMPRETPYLEPYETKLDNRMVQLFLKELYANGERPKIGYGLTVADENVFAANGIPTITWGPVGDGAHSAKEWVSQKSIERLEKVYPIVVQKLING